jgi:hypothetical protein
LERLAEREQLRFEAFFLRAELEDKNPEMGTKLW